MTEMFHVNGGHIFCPVNDGDAQVFISVEDDDVIPASELRENSPLDRCEVVFWSAWDEIIQAFNVYFEVLKFFLHVELGERGHHFGLYIYLGVVRIIRGVLPSHVFYISLKPDIP